MKQAKKENTAGGNLLLPGVFVGQKLYREVFFRTGPSEIKEYEVESIARKYFYLKELGRHYPVDKKTLWYEDKNYSQSNFHLYVDKQSILDRREKERLKANLQRHFSWDGNSNKNTLEELREAAKVLRIEVENAG